MRGRSLCVPRRSHLVAMSTPAAGLVRVLNGDQDLACRAPPATLIHHKTNVSYPNGWSKNCDMYARARVMGFYIILRTRRLNW